MPETKNNLFKRVNEYLDELNMKKEVLLGALLLITIPVAVYFVLPKTVETLDFNQLISGEVIFRGFELENKKQEKKQIKNLAILDKALENSGFDGEIRIIKFFDDKIISSRNFDIKTISIFIFDNEPTEIQLQKVQQELVTRNLFIIKTNLEINGSVKKSVWIIGEAETPKIPKDSI